MKQGLLRLVRGHYYVSQHRNGKYLLEFRGKETYYRLAERRVRYLFMILGSDYTIGGTPMKLTLPEGMVASRILEEVKHEDLPTYVGWPYLSTYFSKVISTPKSLRLKLRRKRLKKRMLQAE